MSFGELNGFGASDKGGNNNNSGKSSKYDSIKAEQEFNEYLKHELYDKYIKPCEAIRTGLACVVPINIFALYTSDEVEQLVTGSRKIDVELLKTKTNLDGYNDFGNLLLNDLVINIVNICLGSYTFTTTCK